MSTATQGTATNVNCNPGDRHKCQLRPRGPPQMSTAAQGTATSVNCKRRGSLTQPTASAGGRQKCQQQAQGIANNVGFAQVCVRDAGDCQTCRPCRRVLSNMPSARQVNANQWWPLYKRKRAATSQKCASPPPQKCDAGDRKHVHLTAAVRHRCQLQTQGVVEM